MLRFLFLLLISPILNAQAAPRLQSSCPGSPDIGEVDGAMFRGSPFSVDVVTSGPGGVALLVMSLENGISYPVPQDMSLFGYSSGCMVWAADVVLWNGTTDQSNNARVVVPVPLDPLLAGHRAWLQVWEPDASTPLGLTFSFGLEIWIF